VTINRTCKYHVACCNMAGNRTGQLTTSSNRLTYRINWITNYEFLNFGLVTRREGTGKTIAIYSLCARFETILNFFTGELVTGN